MLGVKRGRRVRRVDLMEEQLIAGPRWYMTPGETIPHRTLEKTPVVRDSADADSAIVVCKA